MESESAQRRQVFQFCPGHSIFSTGKAGHPVSQRMDLFRGDRHSLRLHLGYQKGLGLLICRCQSKLRLNTTSACHDLNRASATFTWMQVVNMATCGQNRFWNGDGFTMSQLFLTSSFAWLGSSQSHPTLLVSYRRVARSWLPCDCSLVHLPWR